MFGAIGNAIFERRGVMGALLGSLVLHLALVHGDFLAPLAHVVVYDLPEAFLHHTAHHVVDVEVL